MEKKRITEVWEQLLSAYDKTKVYGRFGVTGNPCETLNVLFEGDATEEEARQVLAIFAKMRPHDGRLDEHRAWLYEALPEECEDWYREYIRYFPKPDDIHPAHLNQIAETLKNRMEKRKS